MAAKDLKAALRGTRVTATRPEPAEAVRPFGDRFREQLEAESAPLPVTQLAPNELRDNPYQGLARQSSDEAVQAEKLEELAESIRSNGFFGALLARRARGGGYELAYGHRRRDAAVRAGLEALPVKVMALSDEQMARIMASENFSREDLTPLGEANVVGHLYTALNMTVKEISAAIGRSRGWVQNRLDLYEAPGDLKQMVEARPDSMSFVANLATVADPAARETLAQQVVAENLTREQLRRRLPEPPPPRRASLRTANSEIGNKPKSFATEMSQVEIAIATLEEAVRRGGRQLTTGEIDQVREWMRRLEKLRP